MSNKTPGMEKILEDLAKAAYGSSRKDETTSVTCGGAKGEFVDEISIKEWGISHMCQKCQNAAWANNRRA